MKRNGRLFLGAIVLAAVGLGAAVHYRVRDRHDPADLDATSDRAAESERLLDGHGQDRAAKPPGQPVPRRMTAAASDRIAERARGDAPIGPDLPIGQETVDPGGRHVILLPDGGGVYHGRPGDNRRKHPDVMSKVEALVKRPDLVEALGNSMDHNEHRFCSQAVVDRAPVTERLTLSFALHVTNQGGKLVIDDVQPLGDGWPGHLVQADIDCFLSAFRGLDIPWDKHESLWVETSHSINPPGPGRRTD